MRLGFVGCGKWASKLAEQFRACGAEIVAYDRKTLRYEESRVIGASGVQVGVARHIGVVDDPTGFGHHRPWRDQLEDTRIDAIVACADPETTTAVALACIATGKPCMATKPLMLTEMPVLAAPLYVDLFRLWGDRWAKAKAAIHAPLAIEIDIVLEGSGPDRSFPGCLDYGPHALAFLLDAFPHATLAGAHMKGDPEGRHILEAFFKDSETNKRITIRAGNGATSGFRAIAAHETLVSQYRGMAWEEPPTLDKSGEIRAMCQAFLDDIAMSNVDTYTLDLSVRGMRLLLEARKMAGS